MPTLVIKGKINIPKPPHAVTMLAAFARLWFGKCLVTWGAIIVPAAPAKPKPTNNPKLIWNHMPELQLFPRENIAIEYKI